MKTRFPSTRTTAPTNASALPARCAFSKKASLNLRAALTLALGLAIASLPAPAAGQVEEHEPSSSLGARAVAYVAEATATGFAIYIAGVNVNDVTGLFLNGIDVEKALPEAFTDGRIQFEDSDGAVSIYIARDLELPLDGDTIITLQLSNGIAVSVPIAMNSATPPASAADESEASKKLTAPSCSPPQFTKPSRLTPTSGCSFGSTSCGKPGWYHGGVDYAGSGSVYAAFAGKVVRVESKSSTDHGMGNNIIIEHPIWNCWLRMNVSVYTTYSHLASFYRVKVGDVVVTGQKIGTSGGSGYGSSTYWNSHLHFEVKVRAVTGNPFGVSPTKCATSNSCWGYTPTWPGNYGYLDPQLYGL